MSRRALPLLLLVLCAAAAAYLVGAGGEWDAGGSGSAQPAPLDPPDASVGGGPALEGSHKRARRREAVAAAPPSAPLAAPYTLAGRVVSPSGAPVPGARVSLCVVTEDGRPLPRASVRADAAGAFRLAGVAGAGGVLVIAEAPGQLHGWRRLTAPAAGLHDLGDLALRGPGQPIRGTVQDADGRPVLVQLAFEREPDDVDEPLFGAGASTTQTSTDLLGAFVSPPLPPGLYRLHVEGAAGHVREHVPAGASGLVLTLPGEAGRALRPLEVRVRFEGATDADLEPLAPGGLPVLPVFTRAGQVLRCQPVGPDGAPPAGPAASWPVRADARFVLAVPRTAGAGIDVRALRGSVPDPRFAPAHFLAPADGAPVELQLRRAATLSGQVRLAGRGVPALVEVAYELDPGGRAAPPPAAAAAPRAEAVTDAEGRFLLGGLPTGQGLLRARPDRRGGRPEVGDAFEPSPWRAVELSAGGVQVDVDPPLRLTLRLSWPAEEPAPGPRPSVRVALAEAGPAADGLAAESAWQQGRLVVEVTHLPRSGPVALVVTSGDAWLVTEPLAPRAEPYDLALRPAARIEGRVLGPDGTPADDGQVWAVPVGVGRGGLAPVSANLDGEGRFSLRPPTPGRYRLEVEDLPQGVVVPVEVDAGTRGLELCAQRAQRLEGRLEGREADDLSAFYVDAVVAGVPAERGEGAWCAEDGAFRLALPGGRAVTLVARAEDPRDARCATASLAPGAEGSVRLTLRAGARLSGRVLGPGGAPLAGARVHVRSELVDDEATTDEAGAFEVLGLPDDVWEVRVTGAGRTLQRRLGAGEHLLRLE